MRLLISILFITSFLAITIPLDVIAGELSKMKKNEKCEVQSSIRESRNSNEKQRRSLLGSPENWLMGAATGVPTIIGWRIERSWRKRPEVKPEWIVGIDLGATVPGVRISTEKQLSHSSFYSGISSRFIFIPSPGREDDNTAYSFGIPISFRCGKTKYLHTTLSIEAFTGKLLKEWRILPTLQISFLFKL